MGSNGAGLGEAASGTGGGNAGASNNGRGRGHITVSFFEKRRRKAWYMRAAYGGGDEEVCWESWTVRVTVAEPKTDAGKPILFHFSHHRYHCLRYATKPV